MNFKKGAIKLKANVDQDTCVGCGICPSICPEVFRMDDEGKAVPISSDIPDNIADAAQNAESSCPVAAISIN